MHGGDDAYYERAGLWAATPRHRAELEVLVGALQLSAGETVLDLGCGTGAALRLLAERGVSRVGVDRAPSWPRFCCERPVVRADAARLPFADTTFDAVILMHVLAHLVDPRQSLREAARVLRPGGRLGMLTPNRGFVAVYRLLPRWWNGYVPDPTVERHYDQDEAARLAREASLDVTHLALTGPPPPLLPLPWLRERVLLVATRPAQRGPATRSDSSTR